MRAEPSIGERQSNAISKTVWANKAKARKRSDFGASPKNKIKTE